MAGKNWIAGAIKHPGAFSAQAKRQGLTTNQLASKALKPGSKASATTQRRARLAKTLSKLRKAK